MARTPESVQFRFDHQSPQDFQSCAAAAGRLNPACEPNLKSRWQSRFRAAASLGLLFVMLSSIGCATVHGEKYAYHNIPRHLIASARENPQTVDLTRLGTSTTTSDIVDRGDVLEITIAAGLNEKEKSVIPVRIKDDGYGDIPEVGTVKLAGMRITEAEAAIYHDCVTKGLYRSPGVTVLMKEQRKNRIMVAGAVKKPAVYEIPRGQCDLLAALSKAEGLDTTAGTQVIIRNLASRNGSQPEAIASAPGHGVDTIGHSVERVSTVSDTIKVDLVSATKNGNNGFPLEDGAMVYVEKRDPEPLHVMGLVTRPGRFEFPIAEEVRVTDAIALAGGVSSLAADKIFVIRRKPQDGTKKALDPSNPDQVETVILQVSLANAKQKAESNLRLAPGDVVSVEQTPITFVLELFKRASMNFGGTIPLLGSPIF